MDGITVAGAIKKKSQWNSFYPTSDVGRNFATKAKGFGFYCTFERYSISLFFVVVKRTLPYEIGNGVMVRTIQYLVPGT